jgi:thiol-disulfide isomerase/thioredoxin
MVAASLQLCLAQAPATAAKTPAPFPPVEQWKAAVISGNEATLKALYSTAPPARVIRDKDQFGADNDVAFWIDLKAHHIKIEMLQSDSPQPGVRQVVFQAEIQSGQGSSAHTLYVTDGQLWQQQGEQWKLTATKRSDPTKLKQPTSLTKDIYPPDVDAHAEIKQALQDAAKTHKRVILVFGANWCYDCHVLDLAFHRPDLAPLLQHNYEVVHVDVGQGEKNQDLMQQYKVPMAKGIPALAVLDSDGKLLYSQTGGEFEKARSLAPEDLLQFLNKWKPVNR